MLPCMLRQHPEPGFTRKPVLLEPERCSATTDDIRILTDNPTKRQQPVFIHGLLEARHNYP